MAYRTIIAGNQVEVDSPQELLKVLRAAGSDPKLIAAQARETAAEWNPASLKQLTDLIEGQGRQYSLLVTLLSENETGVSKSDLVRILDLENANQVGGVLSGLAKNSKKLGSVQAIKSQKRQVKGKRVTIYRLDASLRRAFRASIPDYDRF